MRPIPEPEFLEFKPTLLEKASNMLSSEFTDVSFRDMMSLVVSSTLTSALISSSPVTSAGLIIYGGRALKDMFLRNIKGSEYISEENQKKFEGFFNSPQGKFFFTLSSALFLSGSGISLGQSIKDYVAHSGNKELAALVNSASLLALTSGAFTTAMIGNWAKIFNGLYKEYSGRDEKLIPDKIDDLANHPMMVNIVASLGYFVGIGASKIIDPNYKADPLIVSGASGLALIGFSLMEKYREENKGKSLALEIRDNFDHCFPEITSGGKIAFQDGRFITAEGFGDDKISQKFAENLNLACNIMLANNSTKSDFLKKIPTNINGGVDPESGETLIRQIVHAIAETLKPLERAVQTSLSLVPGEQLAVTSVTPTNAAVRGQNMV